MIHRAAKRPCMTLCLSSRQLADWQVPSSPKPTLAHSLHDYSSACLEVWELWFRLQSNSPVRKQPRGRYNPGIAELSLFPVHRRTTSNQCYIIDKSMEKVSLNKDTINNTFCIDDLGVDSEEQNQNPQKELFARYFSLLFNIDWMLPWFASFDYLVQAFLTTS